MEAWLSQMGQEPSLSAAFSFGSEVKAYACNVGDLGSIPGSGRSPGLDFQQIGQLVSGVFAQQATCSLVCDQVLGQRVFPCPRVYVA